MKIIATILLIIGVFVLFSYAIKDVRASRTDKVTIFKSLDLEKVR